MMPFTFLNGQLLPSNKAVLHLSDLAIIRGYGIFDFFVFHAGRPNFLADYLDRFYRSADYLGLSIPLDRQEMSDGLFQLIEANGEEEGGIRFLLTGGYATDGYTPFSPNLAIIQYPYPHPSEKQLTEGVRLMTHRHVRELPEVKSINYLTGIYLQPRMKQLGADYLLYHDGELVLESDRSNFFIVTPTGELVTPGDRVLAGITRKYVLQLAQELMIPTAVRPVSLEESLTAAEAFLTSSTKGVMPVIAIDGHLIADGTPGPLSLQLQEAFVDLATARREG